MNALTGNITKYFKIINKFGLFCSFCTWKVLLIFEFQQIGTFWYIFSCLRGQTSTKFHKASGLNFVFCVWSTEPNHTFSAYMQIEYFTHLFCLYNPPTSPTHNIPMQNRLSKKWFDHFSFIPELLKASSNKVKGIF